jgi:hypothetical protein
MRVSLLDWLFRDVEAEFQCGAVPDVCASHLRKTFPFEVASKIGPDAVSVRRHRPWQRNAMGPYFIGAFAATVKGTKLRGTLKVNLIWKILLASFIIFCVAGIAIALGALVIGAQSAAKSLCTLLFFCVALYLARWEIQIWRRDARWLSDSIQIALSRVT